MIRFIDIESGNVFNGSKPYTFWMDNEQSVNLIYIKKICAITNAETINISIPEDSVFKIVNAYKLTRLADTTINEFKYKDINQCLTNSIFDVGEEYEVGEHIYYVHMIYILGQSDSVGEVHDTFTITEFDEGSEDPISEEFEVAADFYSENESLRINLANFGVEIPESIQTAIYDENVHEESKDNILLNRKYKELLLNYWSIVAGRGSYKSLIDSLNWFEYGDLVKIEEIWRHDEWGQTRLNREELNLIMTEEVRSTLSNFAKTTYIGIYTALQKYVLENGEVQYDKLDDLEVNLSPEQTSVLLRDVTSNDYEGLLGEMNPKLENKFFKWSVQEMSLKMYLLGSFYEAYFMPLHLDLMHSTIESIVFTNTLKCLNTSFLDRTDHVYNTQAFECNIQDESTYQLQDVHVQGGDSLRRHWNDEDSDDSTNMVTAYGDSSSDDYDSYPIFGVEDEYDHPMQYSGESSNDEIVNDRLKTFMINNYNGQGLILPFRCSIPAEEGDFINSEKIIVSVYRGEILYSNKVLTKYYLYRETQGKYAVNFNLLLNQEGKTVITLYFTTSGGRSYIKVLHLNILGDSVCKIKMFKVKSSNILEGLNADDYKENIQKVIANYPLELQKHVRPFNDYMFTHTRDTALGSYRTFIPCTGDSEEYGAKLNHVLIFDASFFDNASQADQERVLKYTKDPDSQHPTRVNIFDIGKKEVRDENNVITKTYYILVSKPSVGFAGEYAGTTQIINDMRDALSGYILRYSKGFFFQHHYLEEIGLRYNPDSGHYEYGISLDDYTITDKDTLCVIPDMKYSNVRLDETEWIFRNVSTKDKEEYRYESIEEPFVGNNIKQQLKPGFYDVIFRYRIDQTDNEVELCSAFRKV